MKKNKKKKSIKKIIIILLILIILLGSGYGVYKYYNKDDKEIKIIQTIKGYDYTLKETATEIYKENYKELEKVLSEDIIDYDDYAKAISKLFIIDFYTLENKQSKNDIGGIEFVHPDIKDNFIEKSRSTFYKYLEVKSDARDQQLPEVSKIDSVEVEQTEFKYTDKTIEENAYKVTIDWSYKIDYEYETRAEIILIKLDKKLYIIEMN